jgi:proline dehydrogenase
MYIFDTKFVIMDKNIFNNTEVAFAIKSDAALEKAYWLFRMIKNESLVKLGTGVTKFALKHHFPVESIIKTTVFDHFCGGVTETDSLPLVDKLYEKGVYGILDYSVEGSEEESSFDRTLQKNLELIEFAKLKKEIPFAVFKPTGLGRFSIYEKITAGKELTADEQAEWDRVVDRYDQLAKKAYENDVPLMIDAEETWMQTAADDLVEKMMEKYNTEKAIVFNTLQLYRKDRLPYLKELHKRAKAKGYKIGMKLVRGAYMEKERERAEKMGYEDPICKDKAATDKNYDDTQAYMVENIDDMVIYSGTHNENSAFYLTELVEKYGLQKNDKRIWFGQLLGMSDHITFNLAKEGYNTSKYIPFGPVKDVMPYLIRRAEENTSVAGQTSRELQLLNAERKRRKLH